jgi:hypothetical protein
LNEPNNRGPVMYAHDALEGINTTLRYAVFQSEPRGDTTAIAPGAWADVLGQLRAVLAKEADLVSVICASLQSWKAQHANDFETAALADEAVKQLRSVERSLMNRSRKTATAQLILRDCNEG